MAKESFMLVSLKGDKAKKLAQVMANPTCTRILEYLAGKDATESQVAKDLGMPLSTVHYNLQQLVEAKLVVIDEFHYSEKGREVNHYKLANKYIIIAPQEEDPSFLQNLRKYVPLAIITVGFAAVIKTMQFFTGTTDMASTADAFQAVPEAAPMAKIAADTAMTGGEASTFIAQDAAPEAARMMAAPITNETVNESVQAFAQESLDQGSQTAVSTPWWQSPMLDYFIAGAIFVLLVLIIIEAISYWRSQRK